MTLLEQSLKRVLVFFLFLWQVVKLKQGDVCAPITVTSAPALKVVGPKGYYRYFSCFQEHSVQGSWGCSGIVSHVGRDMFLKS